MAQWSYSPEHQGICVKRICGLSQAVGWRSRPFGATIDKTLFQNKAVTQQNLKNNDVNNSRLLNISKVLGEHILNVINMEVAKHFKW